MLLTVLEDGHTDGRLMLVGAGGKLRREVLQLSIDRPWQKHLRSQSGTESHLPSNTSPTPPKNTIIRYAISRPTSASCNKQNTTTTVIVAAEKCYAKSDNVKLSDKRYG